MRLWSVQDEASYKTLLKKGFFRCDLRSSGLPFFKEEYDWIVSQMIKRVGPKPRGVVYPIWAWRQWDREREKPDLGSLRRIWGRKGARYVMLELEVPERDVLLSDFEGWNAILNGYFAKYSNGPDDREAWERIFHVAPSRVDSLFCHKRIQASFWELRRDQVLKASSFTSNAPILDVLCEPLVSCTTNSSRNNKGLGVLKATNRVPIPRPIKPCKRSDKARNNDKRVAKEAYRHAVKSATEEMLEIQLNSSVVRKSLEPSLLDDQRAPFFTKEWLFREQRRATEREIAEWRRKKDEQEEGRRISTSGDENEKGDEENER